ncbi:MAG: DUF5678 domain-containing protein [Bacteroidota bacterium]
MEQSITHPETTTDTSFVADVRLTAPNLSFYPIQYNWGVAQRIEPRSSWVTADISRIKQECVELSDEKIIEIEKKIFESMKDRLIKRYEGKYIAMSNGKVLASAKDFSSLAKKVYEKHGYRAMYMPLVSKSERQFKLSTPLFSKKKKAD